MNTPFYLINVFTNTHFNCKGNPCAVLHLKNKLDTTQMQKIAFDLNYPATAFLNRINHNEYEVKWFAPDSEINLCGHGAYASLASLYKINSESDALILHTTNNLVIKGIKKDNHIIMGLKSILCEQDTNPPQGLSDALGCKIINYHVTNNKHIVVTDSQQSVVNMNPDFAALKKIDVFGYTVTALANESSIDFVSRTLVPHVQQLEDHATGSSHAALFPYWKDRLNKSELTALQLSPRGGYFIGKLDQQNVLIQSEVDIVMTGVLDIK